MLGQRQEIETTAPVSQGESSYFNQPKQKFCLNFLEEKARNVRGNEVIFEVNLYL